MRPTKTDVLVATIGANMVDEKLKVCGELWKNDINAEFLYKVNPKP